MNPKLHTALRILFALFLIVSGAKHLYTVYWGDPTIMATGYPEAGAEAFVLAVLATKFLLPMICTTKLIAGVLMLLPKRSRWVCWWRFLTAWECWPGAYSWCPVTC